MPSKEGIDFAGEVLEKLKNLDPDDVDFVLTVLEASFPKERSKPTGRKGGGSPKGNPTPSTGVAQGNQGRGGGGRSASRSRIVSELTLKSVGTENPEVEDLLPSVIRKMTPLTQVMPQVSRDSSADTPKSDRKSVQKRLNSKRAELQNALLRYSGADDDYYGFESLNKVQAFLLAAIDANNTEGVRLRTDPLPADFPTMINGLKAIVEERKNQQEVTDYGFFSNSDHHYVPPQGGDNDD